MYSRDMDAGKPDFAERIYGAMCIGTKYEVDSLRNYVIKCLARDWPTTLKDWDKVEDKIIDQRFSTSKGVPWDDIAPSPAAAIRLARHCNIPQILPMAFYALSRLPSDTKTEALRKDSHNASHLTHPYHNRIGGSARLSLLDPSDRECVANGRHRTIIWTSEAVHEVMNKLGSDVQTNCTSRNQCAASRSDIEKATQHAVIVRRGPLKTLRNVISLVDQGLGWPFCEACKHRFVREFRQLREQFFAEVPDFFDV